MYLQGLSGEVMDLILTTFFVIVCLGIQLKASVAAHIFVALSINVAG